MSWVVLLQSDLAEFWFDRQLFIQPTDCATLLSIEHLQALYILHVISSQLKVYMLGCQSAHVMTTFWNSVYLTCVEIND